MEENIKVQSCRSVFQNTATRTQPAAMCTAHNRFCLLDIYVVTLKVHYNRQHEPPL